MNKVFFSVLIMVVLLAGIAPVFADKAAVFPHLNNPFFIHADDSRLYITDGPTISIISLKDYKLLKTFGKAGEGPKEFKVNPYRSAGSVVISIQPDCIFVNSLGKVSYFTKKGEFIKETRTNSSSIRFQPLGEQFAGEGFVQEGNIRYSIRSIYDANFKKSKELYRRKSFAQVEGDINPFFYVSPIMIVSNNRVFINGAQELEIYVFDGSGQKIRTLSCDQDKLVITAEHKEKIHHWFKTYRSSKQFYDYVKDRFAFPEYFPGVRDFKVADQKVYVLTYKREGDKSGFVIFDIEGKLLKEVMVPLAEIDDFLYYPYTIQNGKLYQLIDNAEEEWELHVTAI